MQYLSINSNLNIPLDCLKITYSRSSGPGGQNVNKLNTRVCVTFNVPTCCSLSEEQKQTLLHLLRNRLDKQGNIRVFCQLHRSQIANRNAALERLTDLIREALKPRRKRKKTNVPRKAVEKRLSEKKMHSERKKNRSGDWAAD